MNAVDHTPTDSNPADPPVALPRAKGTKRWVRAVLLLIVFIGGLSVGVAGTLGVICYHFEHRFEHPQDIPARITHRLQRKLGLTDQQAQQIQRILAKRQASLLAIRREIRPRVEAEMDQTQREIDAVLTDEQAKRCRAIFKQMRRRWMRGHHPPPHVPPPPCPEE